MSVEESGQLARLVQTLNRFDGIALLAPIFYKVINADQLVSYLESILNKTDGQMPLLYYHFPDRTGQQNCNHFLLVKNFKKFVFLFFS
ncbi:hypothetical protein BLA29_014529 [Euroglyphus maynei]|uniref:Uncharacterized protein n=1 Tax=Euroglyphus maynei TaxID=6958 RepID=A0A1Y3ASA7_EURMA|nr:hypothetical protein BLA29_014529 [Euroglyphus maynei]